MKYKSDLCEENLYPFWENFCLSQSWSDDLRLQGLNAGSLNIMEGPDFQGAEFELDGKVYHGDVEIHQTSNDWFKHYHHLDRRYNSVQLHLVLQELPNVVVYTSDERSILTLPIRKLMQSSEMLSQKARCRMKSGNVVINQNAIGQLSFNRLNYKILRVKNLIKEFSYDQVLFLLFMRILGSPNNKSNFELLALSLNWEEIVSIKAKYKLCPDEWIKFLYRISGLTMNKSYLAQKVKNNNSTDKIPKHPVLSLSNWRTSGQRPGNQPEVHLKILANWICKFSSNSLYFPLKKIISQRYSINEFLQKIEEFFSPETVCFPDNNKSSQNNQRINRWGRSKIIEIIGNVLIPFFYWEAMNNSSYGFQEYLKDIFVNLPQLNKYAKLREIEAFFPEKISKNPNFYEYQGFLHLHEYYCKKGECINCPLLCQDKEIDKNIEYI